MKALGIVRKIDDLGRVVIPKEVRISQGWEPGHSMEMFMSG
ncbi:MAG TPA: AbrB family transcriptional regulator, partial [Pseudogracilibacillus sp.]|nr:AbrB family transcriptional regulator [Pseudogracilibacillus sp.]